jgi:hypothetical protein
LSKISEIAINRVSQSGIAYIKGKTLYSDCAFRFATLRLLYGDDSLRLLHADTSRLTGTFPLERTLTV